MQVRVLCLGSRVRVFKAYYANRNYVYKGCYILLLLEKAGCGAADLQARAMSALHEVPT